MLAHASWRTLCARSALGLGGLLVSGCEPSVSARAVWLGPVGEGGSGSQTIHVFDQGQVRDLVVHVGETEPILSLRLDRRGRGLLVRSGEQRAAWIDLHDDRRLPILLPPPNLVGVANVAFAEDGSALIWTDFDPATLVGSLSVLPVGPGLLLESSPTDGVRPLVRAVAPRWWLSASAAPVALIAEAEGGRVGLWRWPSDPNDAMVLRELATATRSGLPSDVPPSGPRKCGFPSDCVVQVGLDPAGELAMFADDSGVDWQRFDVRAPDQAGLLNFPSELDELIASTEAGLGLIHVLDRDHSLWLSSGLLHWWDHRTDELRSLPVLGDGPFHVVGIDRGRGVLFISMSGPVLRGDSEGLRPVSLVTTPCLPAGDPVVSADGGWVAWTCFSEAISELSATQGVVVRVSALGLDRYAGVPMTPLAIDDQGHLLLFSGESIANDSLDGVDAQDVPRNLFVLSREGVLTRVDELEPAPVAVFVDSSEFGAFIQAVSF